MKHSNLLKSILEKKSMRPEVLIPNCLKWNFKPKKIPENKTFPKGLPKILKALSNLSKEFKITWSNLYFLLIILNFFLIKKKNLSW